MQPMVPANTPVELPFNDSGSMPDRSSASQHTSSSMRCCGSIIIASFGLIPKNAASKSVASCRNPPSARRPAAASARFQ
jgi:hypothetical protein